MNDYLNDSNAESRIEITSAICESRWGDESTFIGVGGLFLLAESLDYDGRCLEEDLAFWDIRDDRDLCQLPLSKFCLILDYIEQKIPALVKAHDKFLAALEHNMNEYNGKVPIEVLPPHSSTVFWLLAGPTGYCCRNGYINKRISLTAPYCPINQVQLEN